jgi:hypothetical protein
MRAAGYAVGRRGLPAAQVSFDGMFENPCWAADYSGF